MLSANGLARKRNGKRVLIIDGVQSIGDLYETILRLDGYIIDTVNTIEEALSHITTFQPDLIIATPDLFYLKGYGPSALSELKLVGPNIPILAITAQKNPEFRQYLDVAASLHLPVKMSQLRETVTRLVEVESTPKSQLFFKGASHSSPEQLSRSMYY